MKRKWIGAAVLVMLCTGVLLGAAGCGGKDKPTLRIFNSGEYIEKSLLTKFEKKYNCKIVYETYDSNESMYTKLASGSEYDILVPSDYMIERLIKEDYLQKIDWDKIINKDALIPTLMDKEYDQGEKYSAYSVPYFWGSVGILYDTEVVDEEDLEQGWEILRNKKYAGNIYMYDSERDALMIALKSLGYSMNTENKKELDEAYEWLEEQRETMDPVYVGDDVIDNMISGNKAMAVVYSGDGALIIDDNDKLDFFEPKQGTNLWYDGIVITKYCEETELAHKFLNFLLEEDNALLNDEEIGYSSSVQSVFETMRDENYKGIDAYVPRTDYEKDEVFRYQKPDIKSYCADLWTKVKAQ